MKSIPHLAISKSKSICEHPNWAHREFKTNFSSPPMLKFTGFDKTFDMHTEESDFANGGLLRLDGWPLHMRA